MTMDVGAYVASTTSACCVIGVTGSSRARIGALLMLAAMIACVLAQVAPGARLVAFACALASVPFALVRIAGRVQPVALHRAVGGVVMAALAVTGHEAVAARGVAGWQHHGVPLHVIVLMLTVGYAAHGVRLVVRSLRRRETDGGNPTRYFLGGFEVVAMTTGTLLMAAV
ncbi:hypothetical protein WDJ51_11565 [Rathayibacter sp. YIM 133350]|uniref:hypothetical protein n=1 Tax=Rathayibacter sp. YIM 133350 TaxID=3131992 RepID=UPI00307D6FB9